MKEEEEAPVQSQETASLVKRLAGPSTGKAGLVQDQTEINRIIADASKGSKFYENEKRKDKDLTERISKILKQRDEAIKGVNIETVEKLADHLISDLEGQRDLTQTIVHIDMDAFFANVELRDNPELQGKAFGVGHGVLTTASYEARKYGVRSGMPTFIAKKLCPDLILVSNRLSKYMESSSAVMTVLRRYDPELFAASCDEAYLNITAYCLSTGLTAEECVQEMRRAVHAETGLTASAGIAPNKMLAKICSDKNKPNGQFLLPFDRDSILSFLRDLSIRRIPGIGRVNERLLEAIGIKTCGDIFTHRAMVYLMDKQLGRQYLFSRYLGISSNIVQPSARSEKKSMGAERTFSLIKDKDKILEKLEEVAAELEKDLEQNGWTGRTVTLKYKLDTFQVFTRSKSLDWWVKKKEDLYQAGKELLLPDLPLSLRLIGLRLTKLKDLRAPSPVNGIKRFFEPLQGPAAKRRRTGDVEDDLDQLDEEMPGLLENEDDDGELDQMQLDGDSIHEDAPDTTIQLKPRPPNSVPALAFGPPPTKSIKPHSSGPKSAKSSKSAAVSNLEDHECPICGKTVRTDNQGLNTHIDFCLSRGVIRQAHAEATQNSDKRKLSTSRKPASKGKHKA